MSKRMRGNLLLLLTAFIWGTAFVAQKDSMSYIGPFTFNCVRMLLAALALLVVIQVMEARQRRTGQAAAPDPQMRRTTWIGGVACGVALFVASSLQQFGVQYTTAGKAGFITALYIVLVPILGLFIKKKVKGQVWLGVVVAVAGLYLLCVREGFSVGLGDALVTLCALCFAVHILVIDHFSPRAEGVKMSCIQFFVCGMLALVAMAIFESPSLTALADAWLSILYAGLVSGGAGYTLQIIAQKHTGATVASLIMSLEAVFAVVAGGLLLGERLDARELAGCILMSAAVVLAQIDWKRPEKVVSAEESSEG